MENISTNPAAGAAATSSTSRADRKTIERNRRSQMKELYSHLGSLLPPPQQASREPVSLTDRLEEAAKYIKRLQTDVVRLNERKERLVARNNGGGKSCGGGDGNRRRRPPRVEVRESGLGLEVVMVAGSGSSESVFKEMVRVVEEEGGEVVNASFSVVEDLVFCTIHSKVGDGCGVECGVCMGRISERLKKLVDEYDI